ncbi:MAG: SDR family oxidoreductase [Pseudomonadota bacterium]
MTQTILITGCSSGFGKVIARTFHDAGWNVAATMRAPELERELRADDRLLLVRLDVTEVESVDAAFEAARVRFGAVDAVVNNAGYGGNGMFEQFSAEDVDAMYATNVFGAMHVMRAALPEMRAAGRGVIVNVTSMAGHLGLPGNSVYASTKHALVGLTEAMALEYAPLGVRICNVAPGAYSTGFNAAVDWRVEIGDADLVAVSRGIRTRLERAVQASATERGAPADVQEVADHVFACVAGDRPINTPSGHDAEGLWAGMGQQNRQAFLEQLGAMLAPAA